MEEEVQPVHSRVDPDLAELDAAENEPEDRHDAPPRRTLPSDFHQLRRRRRAKCAPIPESMKGRGERYQTEGGEESDESDDSDEEDDDSDTDSDDSDDAILRRRRRRRLRQIECPDGCCCSVRGIISCCILFAAIIGWSVAVSLGILHQPTYEEVVRPIRIARQFYFSRAPVSADDGFILFDQDADGLISEDDLAAAIYKTTGKQLSPEDLHKYIAQADFNGDGALNETEYLALLYEERRARGESGPVSPPAPASP